MNKKSPILFLFLCLFLVSFLGAQVARQTGVIRGVVTDNDGTLIPGMTVNAKSPALLGTISDVTNNEGAYRLANLSPGTYEVTAELTGFKTVRQGGVIVQVGQIITVNIRTEPSAIQEEITVEASAPTIDVQSTKVGSVVSSDMIQRLPLSRNLLNVFNTVAGSAGNIDTYSGSIHGGSDTTIGFEVDGVNSNDPAHGGLLLAPQFDAIEEIEISTGGLPAQVGNTGGSFVNLVTKSGGNQFHGRLQAYYTDKALNQVLFSDEQLKALKIGTPNFYKYDFDFSGILGGPIIKDKLWFFSTLSYVARDRLSTFIPTTIMGKQYDQYSDPQNTKDGSLKLSYLISKNLRFFAYIQGRVFNEDVQGGGATYTALDATKHMWNNTWVTSTANLTWLMSSNTFMDIRAGYTNRWYPSGPAREGYENNITYTDSYTGYSWNGYPTWISYMMRTTVQGSARMTHFADNILGGSHEIGAGVEYLWGNDRWDAERQNPLRWYYWNDNPYYYRGYYNLSGPHPTFGDGRISFGNMGNARGATFRNLPQYRIGGYLQDAWTIKNRLTFNFGVRFDYNNGWLGETRSAGVTDPLTLAIGETLVPQLEALYGPGKGFNPFGPWEIDPIKNAMDFMTVSPRFGVTYDLTGNGKTALKLAISRYAEAVPDMWFGNISPSITAQYLFDWWDLNKNGQPDMPGIDRYVPTSGLGTFTAADPEYLRSRVDKGMTTPTYTEIVASINHELFRNFAVKLQYIHKRGRDLHGDALYDKATGKYWYNYDQSPEWWVPFTTIVPAVGNYPAQEVTAYFMSNNAPWNNQFTLQMLLPDSKRDYDAVELAFDKRFTNGWSFGGSFVYSKHMYFSGGGANPNQYTNGYGRASVDMPLAIKLFGTVELPYKFFCSFFFIHTSGTPYGRTVSIAPPTAWAKANNVYPTAYTVNLESSGSRRNQSYDNLDLRIEKELEFHFGKFGVFGDIYNLLGNQYLTVGNNPGGTWRPTGASVTTGTYSPASTYGKVTNVSGTRTYKLSLRFSF